MLNDHFEAEKNGDENSTMLHYVRLGSNLKTLQFDEDTGTAPKYSLLSFMCLYFEPVKLIINQLNK